MSGRISDYEARVQFERERERALRIDKCETFSVDDPKPQGIGRRGDLDRPARQQDSDRPSPMIEMQNRGHMPNKSNRELVEGTLTKEWKDDDQIAEESGLTRQQVRSVLYSPVMRGRYVKRYTDNAVQYALPGTAGHDESDAPQETTRERKPPRDGRDKGLLADIDAQLDHYEKLVNALKTVRDLLIEGP